MDTTKEFLRLLDDAITRVESVVRALPGNSQPWILEDATTAKTQLLKIRTAVVSGTLPTSAGAGLGITRALGEWAPGELYSAGKAVEDFFKSHRN